MEDSIEESISSSVWGIDAGAILNIGGHSMEDGGRHDFLLVGDEGADFSGGLRNGENEGSFYNLGEVPWQLRTPLQEAKSLLQWNNPFIG